MLYKVEWDEPVAVIRLNAGRANALNHESLAAVDEAFGEVERAGARGVVLTGYGNFFSAGLDLVTLWEMDRAAMDRFVTDFDRVMLRIFSFPFPVVAGVNGYAVAGGAIMALACDARLMRDDDGKIGLNEIRLGLPFPASAMEILRHALSIEYIDSILYGGQLYTPMEAMARGLVDGLTAGDVLDETRAVCRRLAEQSARAYSALKASLKGPAVRRAQESLDDQRRVFLDAWFSPEARRLVGEARSRLSSKR